MASVVQWGRKWLEGGQYYFRRNVVAADGAPPESRLASSLVGLHCGVSPRGGAAGDLSGGS
jgi:hypothetical protein